MVRPIATRINKDNWGFYQVGDLKTYSKLEAIELSGKIKKPVEWNYNQAEFSQFNWTQEPPGTLEDWYRIRAQQLRDKYDYLVLFYSGGADSHNVLMSFVKNNIFVDEIVQFHSMSAYRGDKSHETNAEIFETSIPITETLIDTNPTYKNTVHRVLDITDLEAGTLTVKDNKWDYFYNTNSFFSPWSQMLGNIRKVEPSYEKLYEQGKNVCFVFGVEKPIVTVDSNQNFYIEFHDRGLVYCTPRNQKENVSWHNDEGFYWTPDLPELAAKQAHIVKRFLQGLTPEMVDGFYIKGQRLKINMHGTDYPIHGSTIPRSEITINNVDYMLTNDGLHNLIYPYWNPTAIVCPKPRSNFFGQKDDWMWNSMAPDLGQQHYKKSIPWLRNYVKSLNPAMWWEFKYDPSKGPYKGGFKVSKNSYSLNAKN